MTTDRPLDLGTLQAKQSELRTRVRLEPLAGPLYTAGAVDLHLSGRRFGNAVAVLWSIEDERVLESVVASGDIDVPYVPGYLSFREAPLCLKAVTELSQLPDVLLVDGHGIAHPRRFGLACHIGVELDIPVIGVAKSRLYGDAQPPGPRKGDRAPILDGDEMIGMVVRSREDVKPLYVSPGHRIDVAQAVDVTLSLCSRYRLPDPSRAAHAMARDAARMRADPSGMESETS
jgi:deoxyribonuclease V